MQHMFDQGCEREREREREDEVTVRRPSVRGRLCLYRACRCLLLLSKCPVKSAILDQGVRVAIERSPLFVPLCDQQLIIRQKKTHTKGFMKSSRERGRERKVKETTERKRKRERDDRERKLQLDPG